jgi:hypothetical protein
MLELVGLLVINSQLCFLFITCCHVLYGDDLISTKHFGWLCIAGGVASVALLFHLSWIVLNDNPAQWLIGVLSRDNYANLFVSIYWIVCIGVTAVVSRHYHFKSLSTIIQRKLFHFQSVIMFLPILINISSQSFVVLSFGVALSAFLYIESFRCTPVRSSPLLKDLYAYFDSFLLERSSCYISF